MEKQEPIAENNRLLALLAPELYKQLRSSLEPVTLSLRRVLQEPLVPMSHVYFPLNTVCSVLVSAGSTETIEVATVGREGMVGLPVFLGADTMPTTTLVQVSGEALRLPSDTFRRALKEMPPLQDLMQRYTQAMFMLVAQSVACNREHDTAQRCARWLLMTRDRVGSDQFPLTQEFLAQMLGVRRAGVNEVATRLQQEGLIEYHRGMITILDQVGLEGRSCACYCIVRDEFERSLGVHG